jgi:AcrR family transcriptional regulator
MAATAPPGLRERKKRRTRRTIVDVGIRLFAEQGYDETTVAQIADEADVATSTFFNYFRTKDEIVFAAVDAIIDSARARILGRADDEAATPAILAWISEVLPEVEAPYSEALRELPRIVAAVPDLQAGERLRQDELGDVFAEAYARDLGETADDMKPRVMATIALRAMVGVWEAWYEQHSEDPHFDLNHLIEVKAEYLQRVLTAGLAAVEALPAPPA